MTTAARGIELAIFDLDGTLVDSAPDIAWALNATLAEAGVAALPLDTVIDFVGDGAAKLIERALRSSSASGDSSAPGDSGDAAALLARFLVHYADHLCVGTRLYDGILELLDRVARAGVAAAVITNKPHALARGLLERLGIVERFTVVIGDGDGHPRKPSPDAARAIIARAGTGPERTVVIGDGLPDVRMAHAIPCRVVAACWGYVPRADLQAESPTFIAASPHEAAQILASL
jgi:phosphoglycolate phosphatase